MTTGVIETKGTRLFFSGPASSPAEILKVACPTGINGLGGPGNQIDTTCLDSEEMEFRRGMRNPGPLNVPVNFIPQSESHQALINLADNGETVDWMIVLSDQAGSPVTVTNGLLVSPGATTARFQGYLADLNIDVATNEIVRATLTIQRSGAVGWNLPTAIYD